MAFTAPFKSFPLAVWQLFKSDAQLFKRFPRMALAVLAISAVPAIYALIYLSSVWDPNTKTNALPVAIVNLDHGLLYQGRLVNVGADLSAGLVQSGTFGFRTLHSAQEAREQVIFGKLAFAVVIPSDFSANAVPGLRAGDGQVTVIFSEGNNYAAAGFARRFATELGHQVNQQLNEKRWEQVLLTADGSGKSLAKLKAGMAQLSLGAKTLELNANKYNSASNQMSMGFKQLGAGLRSLEDKLPLDEDLKSLQVGTARLSSSQRELGSGLAQLQSGAGKLTEGATLLQEQTADIPFVGEKVAKGASELAAGGDQLKAGLSTALEANARLVSGSTMAESSTEKLIDGFGAMGEGVHLMVAKLPEDERFDTYVQGGKLLLGGIDELRAGIQLVAQVLPSGVGKPDGSARGLADSVEPALEVVSPVANNGSAFAPNMVAMALWLGAVMSAYIFNMGTLQDAHTNAPRLAKALGKFAFPAAVSLLQVALTFSMLVFGLGINAPDYLSFALTMMAASLTFLAVVFLLLRVFGEAGKLIAVLLLTLQLAAGGGVMPIELSGGFFQLVHEWLPFTWVIKAFRASLFGAFNNGWTEALMVVVAGGISALLLAAWAGKWRVVPADQYKPGIDV